MNYWYPQPGWISRRLGWPKKKKASLKRLHSAWLHVCNILKMTNYKNGWQIQFTQTHVHRVGDAIQPSHPPLSPSPPAFNLSQHQGLFQWDFASGSQSIGASASVSVLPKNIQGWFPLGLTSLISLLSKGLSRVFSRTTVQKHQIFCCPWRVGS